MYKIIDLSLPHENNATESSPPSIEYLSHEQGIHRLSKIAGLAPVDFPHPTAMATDIISGKTHSGTHIDSPYHYGPLCEGRQAKTVDEIPLEWLFAPGVILDMRHKNPGDEVTVDDMKLALEKISYEIKPGDIVVIQTGADKYWGTTTAEYMENQSGLNVTGLDWILDHEVRVVGIDAWTLDRPVKAMVESYRQTGDSSYLWPSHYHGRNREYIQIEKMANLDALPVPYGFTISVLPVKFKECSAGWCRAVAIFEE